MRYLALLLILAAPMFGAASLAIGTSDVATDGYTVTVPITGGSGDLTPTTGITGFTVTLTNSAGNISTLTISSVTASGTTVTINLNAFADTGKTVTISLAVSPTSNLTDASSNTPSATGNTDHACTNNSTLAAATGAVDDTTIFMLGVYGNQGTSSGHHYRTEGYTPHLQSTITTFVGTTLLLHYFQGPCWMRLDGGDYTVVDPSTATGFRYIQAASGLTDTLHTLVATCAQLETDRFIKVTGSAPAVAAPAGWRAQNKLSTTPFTSYCQLDGGSVAGSSSFSQFRQVNADWRIRCRADITKLAIWMHQAPNTTAPASYGPFVLHRDGVQVATTTGAKTDYNTNGATANLEQFDVSAGAAEYELSFDAGEVRQYAGNLYSIIFVGGTGLASVAHAPKQVMGCYGDSITEADCAGTWAENFNGTSVDCSLTAQATGMAASRSGYSGKEIIPWGRDHTAEMTGLTPKPSIVWQNYGVNDEQHAENLDTYQAYCQTMLGSLNTGLDAGALILYRGILPHSTGAAPNRPQYEAREVACVAAYMATNPKVPAYFAEPAGWIDGTSSSTELCQLPTPDHIHPNVAGYAKLAVHMTTITRSALSRAWFPMM